MPDTHHKYERYICIHGHFYQPPRENPWLDEIELQVSAHPYHDWNERVTRECYGPNAHSRILDEQNRILKIINNYEYMSFNFGPTLLNWLERHNHWLYSNILEADKNSQKHFNGHGNSLAQVYNHIIMPLAQSRDKLTQIRWGLKDFRHRFGRDAEGMWLSETAVDQETLDLMEQEGVKFTILSPAQARSVRPILGDQLHSTNEDPYSNDPKNSSWQDVSGENIDTTRPYRVFLNKKRDRYIDIFFYNGPISRGIAYQKLLASGSGLLSRVQQEFENNTKMPSLINIATDGESYGHHFKFGEMALSWVIQETLKSRDKQLCNYGQYLENYSPEFEVKIYEDSSWSCAHGVARWKSDCGCNVGTNPKWNQKWRAPLREGLDWLAVELSSIFEEHGGAFLANPWDARDDYIKVLLDPSEPSKQDYLNLHSKRELTDEEKVDAFRLLESQRMSMFMFTSCGWFFDDISGLEATQVLLYAIKAIDLVKDWAVKDLEAGLMEFLKQAKGNDADFKTGADVFTRLVKPKRIGPSCLAAHHGFRSLFSNDDSQDRSPVSQHAGLHLERFQKNDTYLVMGDIQLKENMTGKKDSRIFLAIKPDGEGPRCLVSRIDNTKDNNQSKNNIQTSAVYASLSELERIWYNTMDRTREFHLNDLPRDSRKQIIDMISREIDGILTQSLNPLEKEIAHLLNALEKTGEPLPELQIALFHKTFLDRFSSLAASGLDGSLVEWDSITNIMNILDTVSYHTPEKRPEKWYSVLVPTQFRQKIQNFLRYQMIGFSRDPNLAFGKNLINFLKFIKDFNITADLWECQNIFYELLDDPVFNSALTSETLSEFNQLGLLLGFRTEGDQND